MTFRDEAGRATSAFVPPGAPGPGLPLFLVPALGLDGRSFAPLAPLAARRRVVFWSPPNDLPRTAGFDGLAAAAFEHADRAGMPRRFVLGGSSLGAMVAMAAALAAPERIAGLVLSGGTAAWRDLGWPMRLARCLHPLMPRRGYHRWMAKVLVPMTGMRTEQDIRLALDLRAQIEHRTREYASSVIAATVGAGAFDLRPRLASLRVPTIVLHARRDRVAPFAAAQSLAKATGAAIVAFDGGSHLPYISRTAEFLAALEPFLARLDQGATP